MEGFYSKEESGRVLGVSVRQIDKYAEAGKLRRVKEGRRVWIPKEDVEHLYRDKSLMRVPTLREIADLQARIEKIETRMKVLQRGLGFGASGAVRGDVELRLLYQRTLDDLSEQGWSIPRVMEFTEDLMRFREEEIESLLKIKGPHSLRIFFDLARRMVSYVELHDQYPSLGTKAVRDRLIQARKTLLALVEITMRIETSPFTDAAREVYRFLGERPDFFSDEIGKYIASG